jgi:RNA polymerase sigma-70 factor (ECF subfamily)
MTRSERSPVMDARRIDHQVGGRRLVELVREYHRPMLAFARSMLALPGAAEEAVQEAWLQVVKSADTFDDRSSVGTWLMGVTRHTALRHRAREKRVREYEVPAAGDQDDPLEGRMHPPGHPEAGHWRVPPERRFLPEERVIGQELLTAIGLALEKLPPRQRQLIILRDFAELTAAEAAEVLDITDEVQRALLYRARGNLRTELEKGYLQ